MVTLDDARDRLSAWMSGSLGAACEVTALVPLQGGAVQENWLARSVVDGGEVELVVRKDAPSSIPESRSRAEEFAVIEVAHRAGVMVPEPVALCEDPSVLGTPFSVMRFVGGIAHGHRVVKDLSLAPDRTLLASSLGRQLARIHAISGPQRALVLRGEPPRDAAQYEIDRLRDALDRMRLQRLALEWGLRWAETGKPAMAPPVLCHRDFRTGNYLVDARGLTGILDWEFAGWGDAMADLGWFCARCWRFSRPDLEAGGIAARADLYRGYAEERGVPVDDGAVRYWEVMAHIRWAVVALQQGRRTERDPMSSLELALTARIVPELELAVMRATGPRS